MADMENHDNNVPENGKNGDSYHNENHKFAPGNPGKPRGASKNKLRDEIKNFLNESWKDFPTWFAKLKEKEKIEIWLALAPYGVARLQSIAMVDSEGNDLSNGLDSRWSEEDVLLLLSLHAKYNAYPKSNAN